MKPFAFAVGAFALSLIAGSATAEVKTFARVGAWEAFGGTTDDGTAVCGVSTQGDGKYIGVKYYKGDTSLTIQLSNETWKVTDGTKVQVTMKFDRQSPWKARANSFHMSDGDGALQFEIDEDQLVRWMREFRASNQLIIGFPNDNVDDWQASLRGTSAIADEMSDCLGRMKRR